MSTRILNRSVFAALALAVATGFGRASHAQAVGPDYPRDNALAEDATC